VGGSVRDLAFFMFALSRLVASAMLRRSHAPLARAQRLACALVGLSFGGLMVALARASLRRFAFKLGKFRASAHAYAGALYGTKYALLI
jgi:hypothetical protein